VTQGAPVREAEKAPKTKEESSSIEDDSSSIEGDSSSIEDDSFLFSATRAARFPKKQIARGR
jgi:hypothetical protein